jgi:hypothetical protein
MTGRSPRPTDRPRERRRPSLLRYGALGAIAAGSVGVADSIIDHVQYGFSQKIGAPCQLTADAGLALCLAGLGMAIGVFVGLAILDR